MTVRLELDLPSYLEGYYIARVVHAGSLIPGRYWDKEFFSNDLNGNQLWITSGDIEIFYLQSKTDAYELKYQRAIIGELPPDGAIIGGMTSSGIPLYSIYIFFNEIYVPGYHNPDKQCADAEIYGAKCSLHFYFIFYERSMYDFHIFSIPSIPEINNKFSSVFINTCYDHIISLLLCILIIARILNETHVCIKSFRLCLITLVLILRSWNSYKIMKSQVISVSAHSSGYTIYEKDWK